MSGEVREEPYAMHAEWDGAPNPENGAGSDTWSTLCGRLGGTDEAARTVDWAQRVVAEFGSFTEWQARRVATVFGYNLARVEDLLPPAE